MEDLRIMRTEVMVGGDDTIRLPIAWERLIRNAQMKFDCGPWRPPKPDPGFGPLDIIKRVKVRLGWGGGVRRVGWVGEEGGWVGEEGGWVLPGAGTWEVCCLWMASARPPALLAHHQGALRCG
jgi:hypothetical protein